MKIFKLILAIGLGCSLNTASALARGINDGTLPLKLDGTAQDLEPGSGRSVTAVVNILTAHRDNGGPNSTVDCEATGYGLKYLATGTIRLGSTSYPISGICTNEADDNTEVIAHSGAATVRITGVLSQQPQARQMEGRLKVVESNQPRSRFLIKVKDSQ